MKPNCIVEYNKYMKGVDRADQYLSYYSFVRKTVKWSKKVVLYLLNCALFNAFLIYKSQNQGKKIKYKNFLHEAARGWITEQRESEESDNYEIEPASRRVVPTPRGPVSDPPGRLSGDLKKHKIVKIVAGGEGKNKYPQRQCRVCKVHKKRSETRYICEFCVMPLHRGACFESHYLDLHIHFSYVLPEAAHLTAKL